jgi:ankyrin repeat protein
MITFSRNLIKSCYSKYNHDYEEIKDFINVQDEHGYTLLMHASYADNIQLVQKLLDNQANINLQDNDGCTALIHACRNNKINTVKFLIEKGALLDIQDDYGKTALMYSCGNLKIVELLVQHNCNKELQNIFGETALVYACKGKHVDVFSYLLENKADINNFKTLKFEIKNIIEPISKFF